MKTNTKKMVVMAMLSALSVILVMLIRVPWVGAGFLEYDPADVPILITTLMYGPCAGLTVTFVVSVIQGLTVSSVSGIIGIIMHILATGSYVFFTGNIYKKVKSTKGLIVSLCFGALVSTLFMLLWNVWFTPLFMNVPTETVVKMLVPTIIPFNLTKTFGNGILSGMIFTVLKKTDIMNKNS